MLPEEHTSEGVEYVVLDLTAETVIYALSAAFVLVSLEKLRDAYTVKIVDVCVLLLGVLVKAYCVLLVIHAMVEAVWAVGQVKIQTVRLMFGEGIEGVNQVMAEAERQVKIQAVRLGSLVEIEDVHVVELAKGDAVEAVTQVEM